MIWSPFMSYNGFHIMVFALFMFLSSPVLRLLDIWTEFNKKPDIIYVPKKSINFA